MAKLYLDVKNQKLTARSDAEFFVEDAIEYLKYQVNFLTDDWKEVNTKKIVFCHNKTILDYLIGSNLDDNRVPMDMFSAPGFTVKIIGFTVDTKGTPSTDDDTITRRIPTNEVFIPVRIGGSLGSQSAPSERPKDEVGATWAETIEGSIGGLQNSMTNFTDGLENLKDQLNEIQDEEHENSIAYRLKDVENKTLISKVENNVLYIDYKENLGTQEG